MCLLEGACGLKTLTSKYVRSRRPPHNPELLTDYGRTELLAVVASEDLAKSSAEASNNTGEPPASLLVVDTACTYNYVIEQATEQEVQCCGSRYHSSIIGALYHFSSVRG